MNPNRYREIDVSGEPREMGRHIGEAAREEVRGFCSIALERVNRLMRVSRASALDVAERSLPFAEAYSPDLVDELRGVAEATNLTLADLMLLQVRNQLQPDPDSACTSFSFASPDGANAFVGQNWDNDPALDEFTIVLTRRPTGKPAVMNVTQAGLIAYIGFNDADIGACLNTLPAPSRPIGVPHYFTLRRIYESRSLTEATAVVRRAERAIPANIMLATRQGPADLEVTLGDVHVLSVATEGWITHTNHCLHERTICHNEVFPELIGSYPRKERIDALLSDLESAPTREDCMRILRDHDQHPRSICRHRNDDPIHGLWQTVFSVVIEPQHRCMHVTRGTPCDHPFELYSLA